MQSGDPPALAVDQLLTGVDQVAAELAIQRLERDIARLAGDILAARLSAGQRWLEGTVGTVVGVAFSLALIVPGVALLPDRRLLSTSLLLLIPGLVILIYVILTRGRAKLRIHEARTRLGSLELQLADKQAEHANLLNRVRR